MAHCGMPRIARRLGSVCQDTGRPRSDHADHGVCRTMAQRCSAPAPVVEGVSHQSARKNGLFPAPRRVNRRRHRPLPVSNLSFPYRWIPACPASQFFSLKNWHRPSHPFHYSQNFLLICSDTTDPFLSPREYQKMAANRKTKVGAARRSGPKTQARKRRLISKSSRRAAGTQRRELLKHPEFWQTERHPLIRLS